VSPSELLRPFPQAALLAASRRLLRPLVQLMVRSGVTLPLLTDVLRRLFVEVAVTDILVQPKARTDSRISLLTGIHRKEIRRYRNMPPDRWITPDVVTISSQIIARWLGSAPFVDEAGRPRPLPSTPGAGAADLSFVALVSSVTTDIRPLAVLENWLSLGIVRMEPINRVVLNADAFIPRPGESEQLFYFGRNLHDHVAAAVANICAGQAAPFVDRTVHYDELTAGQAGELEAFAREAAVRVLLEVNRKALTLIDANRTSDERSSHRVNFGVFVYGENDAPAPTRPNLTDGAAG
jgi:hypothetical protein